MYLLLLIFTKSSLINASVAKVWEIITIPDSMEKWLLDDKVKVTTTWKIGSPINIEVLEHWVLIKTTGKVLKFEHEQNLLYTQLSLLSRLSDAPENYCVPEFKLSAVENKTNLVCTANYFPTESIYKPIVFYWNATLEVITTKGRK